MPNLSSLSSLLSLYHATAQTCASRVAIFVGPSKCRQSIFKTLLTLLLSTYITQDLPIRSLLLAPAPVCYNSVEVIDCENDSLARMLSW